MKSTLALFVGWTFSLGLVATLVGLVPSVVDAQDGPIRDSTAYPNQHHASIDPRQGREQLEQRLAIFHLDQPYRALDAAPAYVRSHRGGAAYLAGLLQSTSVKPETKAQIAGDFLQLDSHRDRLTDAAHAIDRQRGQLYRESLRFDVLGLLVAILSEGKQSFHCSAAVINDAYYSRAEGRNQRFQVVLPEGYSAEQRYPLMVQVFGSASLLPNKTYPFIRVRPSGRGVWGYRSMSRYDVMQVISRMIDGYAVDPDRVYLTGTSAGATGAMHTAALRPDVFAAVVPLVAFGNDLPLENFRNLPLRCEHGVNDWTSSIGNVRVQFQRLKKLQYDAVLNEHPTAGHGIRMPPPPTMQWLFQQRRPRSPQQIVYRCEHPRDGRAYWLRIERFLDPHQVARIQAHAGADGIVVTTKNVQRFSIDPTTAPREGQPIITIDGQACPAEFAQRATFVKRAKWQSIATRPAERQTAEPQAAKPKAAKPKAAQSRRPYGAGAAANLFQGEPLLVVYGTGGSPEENQFLQQAAGVLARSAGPHFKAGNVGFPLRADNDLKGLSLNQFNLLLVGTPQTNAYLAKIADRLPYAVKQEVLSAGGRQPVSVAGSVLSFHYFNPEHPARLIYVVSPYVKPSQGKSFLANPRRFLAGSDGFKMIDQPDLMVRGVDLRIRREMQLDANWDFIKVSGAGRRIPAAYSDRTHLAVAHMKVMHASGKADFALWWGPEDKGSFGGYDFNWLPTLDPSCYTMADYLVRRREVETLTATMSGEELRTIYDRWIGTGELITWPKVTKDQAKPGETYRVVLPMDLVVKLGTRRKALSNVAPGPEVMPPRVASQIFLDTDHSTPD